MWGCKSRGCCLLEKKSDFGGFLANCTNRSRCPIAIPTTVVEIAFERAATQSHNRYNIAPAGRALTEYDREHMITYLRMLVTG